MEIRVVETHQKLPTLDRLAFLDQDVCHLPGDLGCNLGFLGLKRTGGSERSSLVGRFRHADSDLPRQHRSQLADGAGWKADATPHPLDLRWCNGEGDEEGSGKQEHGD